MISKDEGDTERIAAHFATGLQKGDVVGLSGPLGSGKTRFVKGLVAGLGGSADDVVSPTFSLVAPVACPDLIVYHFDLYRLQDGPEMMRLFEEEFDSRLGLAVVEWWEKMPRRAIENVLQIMIEPLQKGSQRKITLPRSRNQKEHRVNYGR